ncbi:MAG: type II toxin-antitoxin system HicB family antitoxin [Chloroflexi bacterium]|jgi:predicted RNase H-like HicB family nuclease|nr:type II toxin-antitoxin system HicB family antitoxin [Chloroflexota bacterium]
MEYSVIVHPAEEGGYWVEVPALPGCYSQGESVDEALSNVAEAIALYLETLRDEGQTIPRDEETVFKVAVTVQ